MLVTLIIPYAAPSSRTSASVWKWSGKRLQACEVVREVAMYADYVIAVDDGSTDDTGKILHNLAADSKGHIFELSLACNCGTGAALLEGFRYALNEFPFEVLVTLDGDRQHRPADIPRLVHPWLEEGAALVIGERVQFEAMPLRSRIGNTLSLDKVREEWPPQPRPAHVARLLERPVGAMLYFFGQGWILG